MLSSGKFFTAEVLYLDNYKNKITKLNILSQNIWILKNMFTGCSLKKIKEYSMSAPSVSLIIN